MKIIELLINTIDEFTGVDAVALVEEPAIQADFYAFNDKEIQDAITLSIIEHAFKDLFVERRAGESKEEYISRCIPVLKSEGYNEDQAAAICYDSFDLCFEEKTVDGKPLFDTIEEAERVAKELGCEGHHVHVIDGVDWYMPCKEHSDLTDNLLENYEFESFTDYPQSATNAAKRALEWRDSHPDNDCGTRVGWARANQLAKREPISEETIARMASFARHLQHKDVPYSEGCGGLMVDAWGGQAGIEWAQNKLERIREEQSFNYTVKKAKNISSQTGTKIKASKFNFALEEDKQMVVGPLMIPNKLILRVDEEGEPYYVFFSEETIRKIAEKMMKFGNNNSLNVEHDPSKPVEGYMTSIWMVEDVEKDKQQVYGFDFPVGTLMGQYKIEDPKVWDKVKAGDIKGFSVEGFFNDRFVQAAKTNI